jgi:hypothetical protein
VTDVPIGKLEYIYGPSSDVAADARWFTEVLGAELRFAIDSDGVRVALLRLGEDSPALAVTDHLPDDRPILMYRVADLDQASVDLMARGWTNEGTIELPMGPATRFHAPGGLRLAIFEAVRPFVIDSMAGRRDF